MHQIKQEYNKLLARWKKAEILTYLPEKHLEALKNLTIQLSEILDNIKNYTHEDAINGFKEDDLAWLDVRREKQRD